ncbi:MAG: glycosyltransferase family 2 protein [Terricaulis sp.]
MRTQGEPGAETEQHAAAPVTARAVSVVVPTRDRLDFLRQALASIRALEAPDLKFEILVADNGAPGSARAVTEAFGAIYLTAANAGAGAARNAALRAATGDFVAFLDDDDAWLPSNIRPQLALLEQRQNIDAVIGQVMYADPDLRPYGDLVPAQHQGGGDDLLRNMLGAWFPQIGATVARIGVRDTIGDFDEALLGGQDQDWLVRLARTRKVAFCEVPSLLFRGRPMGSYDDLNRSRIRFGRKIFLRHALPEWRIWRSPLEFTKAYARSLSHFYYYFAAAAEERANQGQRGPAFAAAFQAATLIPSRALRHMLEDSPLRRSLAVLTGISKRNRPATSSVRS